MVFIVGEDKSEGKKWVKYLKAGIPVKRESKQSFDTT